MGRFLPPQRGDVFAKVEVTDIAVKPLTWRERLRSALSFKWALPADLLDVEFRLVEGVSPWLVYFRDPESMELNACWLAEWHEWVVGAELVAERGQPIAEANLLTITGSEHIPFDLKPYLTS